MLSVPESAHADYEPREKVIAIVQAYTRRIDYLANRSFPWHCLECRPNADEHIATVCYDQLVFGL